MPLIHSTSQEAVSKNIATEKHAHPEMSNAQAAAIAYHAGGEKQHNTALDPPMGEKTMDFGYKDDVGEHKATPVMSMPEHMALAEIAERNKRYWAHDIQDPGNTNAPVIINQQ